MTTERHALAAHASRSKTTKRRSPCRPAWMPTTGLCRPIHRGERTSQAGPVVLSHRLPGGGQPSLSPGRTIRPGSSALSSTNGRASCPARLCGRFNLTAYRRDGSGPQTRCIAFGDPSRHWQLRLGYNDGPTIARRMKHSTLLRDNLQAFIVPAEPQAFPSEENTS